ncbi:MAG TPA: hypothetical protein VEQ40_06140, partial [Pyrinomonadaceae bacterium]|nr:hypothetical protein [Pyrinomonadaceae bacterium]
MLQAPVSFAHEGHHHGEQAVAPLASALPRGEAVSDELELVAIARGETLEVYLDRFATNEPVTGAAIDVETPKGAARAEQGADGAYRIAAPWLAAGGRFDLIFSVSFKDVSDILTLAIEVQPATGEEKFATAAQAGGGVLAGVSNQTLLIALGAFAAGIFVAALAIRRKHAALALVAFSFLIAGAVPSRAHEGHDHSEEKRVEASSVSITSSERAQRLADGSVFAPKPVQRIFALRTLLTEKAAHPKVSELPGRIVPDPNASGYVQSAVGGRLSAPPGGFPRLGTRVKQGDILAHATPPLQAIDVSDIRQRQGELDQQISIVERRLSRFEQLTSSGAASRAQLDETRLELE